MTIIPIHSLKLILKSTLMLVVLGTLTAPVDVLRAGTPQSRPILLVELNAPKVVQYRADDGFMVTARYFSLSDESLHFVKLSMPDRKEYTLPLTLSASGARYADHTLVWWAKGDEAFVEEGSKGMHYCSLSSMKNESEKQIFGNAWLRMKRLE